MRVLIIKTSSMGDIIHTLPALTDAAQVFPAIQFDWVVEENFAEIPTWHPYVRQVIPIALRRWRKQPFAKTTRDEWRCFRKKLSAMQYDFIIDAQGLLKSAGLTRLANGVRCGFDRRSAREGLAALFYQRRFFVEKNQHAIARLRNLMSQVLGYDLPSSVPNYGVNRTQLTGESESPYLVFLHGTTWATKHWPEPYWMELASLAQAAGYRVKLPWGNSEEYARAERIAARCASAEVLPRLDLMKMARILAGAKAIVAVDTGLGHLAAALDVPTVSLYGPTNPWLTGALGRSQTHLAAEFACSPCLLKTCRFREAFPPCFGTVSPLRVWAAITESQP